MTTDDADERTRRSGNDQTAGSEFRFGPEDAGCGAMDDLPGPAHIGVGPGERSKVRDDAAMSGDTAQEMLAEPQVATAPAPRRRPAAEIPAPVRPPWPPSEGAASAPISAPGFSVDPSSVAGDGRLALWLRRGATAALAAVILCGLTVAIGFEHRTRGESIANSDLRIVDGHFESIGNFGFASGGPIGRIVEADGLRLRIDGAAADPRDDTGEVVLYRFSRLDAGGAATPYCQGDPGGMGFPMAGVWTAGVHIRAPGQISVVCLGTAAARCVDLGYRPWRTAANGADLWDYHQACVRALRADYCGSGQSHGDEQHGLALYDRLGIQPLRAADGMSFEAAWDAHGASCVNHMRAPARMTLKDLRTECANLPKARLGNSCDERDPALIFTKSPGASASQPPA